MAVFSLEAPTATVGLPAAWALRIWVNRSAMGSVMLIVRASPARLRKAGNLALVGCFAQLRTGQAEFAVHAARTPGYRAAVALPGGPCVAGLLLQFHLCRRALLRS